MHPTDPNKQDAKQLKMRNCCQEKPILKNEIPVVSVTPVTMDTFLSRNKMHRLLPLHKLNKF